jgi:hypothetical protein
MAGCTCSMAKCLILIVRCKRIFLAVSLVDESAVVDTNSSTQVVRPHSFTFVGHLKDLVYRENTLRHCRVLDATSRVLNNRYEVF